MGEYDPYYDPYANEFGIGGIGGGLDEPTVGDETVNLLRSIGEQINNIGTSMSKAFTSFQDTVKSLEKITDKLGDIRPVTKDMSDPKFGRNVKEMSGMFGKMKGGSGYAMILQKLFDVLKPLMNLLKPFEVILSLISGLISVMVSEALKPMFEAMQPIYDLLMGMMPIFKELGGKLGELLVAILTPFVSIIMQLSPLFEKLLDVFMEILMISLQPLIMILEFFAEHIEDLMPLFEAIIGLMVPLMELGMTPLIVLLEVLFDVLEPLMPLFDALADVLVLITPVISWLAGLLGGALLWAIKAIAYGFAFLIDLFTFGLAGATTAVVEFFEDKPEYTEPIEPKTSETYLQRKEREWIGLQHGGIVLSNGVYELGEEGTKEAVIPLDPFTKELSAQRTYLKSILGELMAQSSLQRQEERNKEFERAFM